MAFLKYFVKFTGKNLQQSLLFDKLEGMTPSQGIFL